MTNIQKPSPAISPRSVLCGQTFFFYTLFFLRCVASRCDFRLCALYSSLRTDFFLLFAMPFADTASIDLRARHDEYSKVLARNLASFRPLRTDFFLFFAMPFTDTAIIDLRARHDEYTKALAHTLASFRPLRTTFFFYTLFFLRCAASRCDFRLCALYSSLRTDFFPFLCYTLCRYGKYRSAARFSRVGRSRYARKIRRYL